MAKKTRREKYITPIAIGFMTTIVPELMSEAFSAYKKRRFTENYWQISDWEKWYAGAAIALTVAAIEANRNRVYYLQGKPITKDVVKDIIGMFTLIKPIDNFPTDMLETLLGEVFAVRHVIIHSHNYEIDVVFRENDWKMLEYHHNLLEGYGRKQFWKLVDTANLETTYLRMNVFPTKIGFEELFIVLMVFDLLAGIADKVFGKGWIAYHLHQKLDDHWITRLSELLTHFYDRVPSEKFQKRIDEISLELRNHFAAYMPAYLKDNYFINNYCPWCHAIAFRKNPYLSQCNKCNRKIEVPRLNR